MPTAAPRRRCHIGRLSEPAVGPASRASLPNSAVTRPNPESGKLSSIRCSRSSMVSTMRSGLSSEYISARVLSPVSAGSCSASLQAPSDLGSTVQWPIAMLRPVTPSQPWIGGDRGRDGAVHHVRASFDHPAGGFRPGPGRAARGRRRLRGAAGRGKCSRSSWRWRPAAARRRPGALPDAEGHPAHCETRPAGPERGVHRRPDGVPRGLRRGGLPADEQADAAPPGRPGGMGARPDKRADLGRPGASEGRGSALGHPARRREPRPAAR